MAGKSERTAEYIRSILPHGFECFQINFWQRVDANLDHLSVEVAKTLDGSGAIISSLGVYGNPLGTTSIDEETRKGFAQAIEMAPKFGCNLVCGFTGRVAGQSVPDSIPRLREVFEPLAHRARELGVRIAFENCPMGEDWKSGQWNIAFNPQAWELIFEALPFENIGLEWEPCHQLCQLIDPMPQLRHYASRIFHVHGKDAKVYHDIVARDGVLGPAQFAFHKHPGLGDSNWTRIIEELRKAGFRGCIDIEGWHDDVYRDGLEMTGQVNALRYLKASRLEHIPNPAGF